MVAVFSAVPEELAVAEGEEAAAVGGLLELAAPGFAELLHAAVIRAMATSPAGAHSILRIPVSLREGMWLPTFLYTLRRAHWMGSCLLERGRNGPERA